MLFREAADYFSKIENVSSRLDMMAILAELLNKADAQDISKSVYLLQGRIAAPYQQLEIGFGEKLVMEAIGNTYGYSRSEIDAKYKEKGDLGLVAEALGESKKQKALFSEQLTLSKVFANLLKMAQSTGKGSQDSKLKLLSELLNSASPIEARYIVRIPLQTLRLGIGDPTVMDALAVNLLEELKKDRELVKGFESRLKESKPEKREEELERILRVHLREKIEGKYNIHPDLGFIAGVLKEKGIAGLREIKITPFIPIRPTLAERLTSSEEIVKKLGKAAVEAKYDGFRLQLHKKGNEVMIFSRQSENMTEMFPEIVKAMTEQIPAEEAILEGEALAYNEETNGFLPFQVTIQRKRKYGVGEAAVSFPLKLFLFDIMFLEGKNLMKLKFRERRKELNKLLKKGKVIELTESITTDDPDTITEFFDTSIGKGLEGIIAKDLEASYIAGARKFAWIKLKKSYKGELQDTIDAVIIGYFKGRGKRVQFGLGTLLTAVYDAESDSFCSIARVGSGLTEQQLQEYEEMLNKIKTSQKPARVNSEIIPDYWVLPKYVVELTADEITKSPLHTAGKQKGNEGLALRFPRVLKLRADRKVEESTTVTEILDLYDSQKYSTNKVE